MTAASRKIPTHPLMVHGAIAPLLQLLLLLLVSSARIIVYVGFELFREYEK